MKQCTKCKINKPLTGFHKNKSTNDSLAYWCKDCVKSVYHQNPERYIWAEMIRRCTDSRNKVYSYYGGRGITVCDRWLRSYENFLEDMGRRPSSKYQLDRIDNDQGYYPENCRWITASVNGRNRRPYGRVPYKGVYLIKSSKKYRAQIKYNGKPIYLGCFITAEEASDAYIKARAKYFPGE